MAIEVACGLCGKRYRVPEKFAGRNVPCQECGETLMIPLPEADTGFDTSGMSSVFEEELAEIEAHREQAALGEGCPECGAPVAETTGICNECGYDLWAGRGRREVAASRRKSRAAAMRTVQLGLSLIFWSLLASLISAFVGVLAPWVLPEATRFRVLGVTSIADVVAAMASMAGRILCLFVPSETRGQAFIFASVALDVLTIVLSLAALGSDTLEQFATVLVLASLAEIAAFVLFLLFVKQLARYVRRGDIADRAQTVLTMGLGLVGIVGGLITLFFVKPVVVRFFFSSPFSLFAFLVALLIVLLLVYIRYMLMVRSLRDAVRYAR